MLPLMKGNTRRSAFTKTKCVNGSNAMRPNAAATPLLDVGAERAPHAAQEGDDDGFEDVAMGDQPHRNAHHGRGDRDRAHRDNG